MTHADGSTRPTNHPTAQGRYRPYPEYRDSRVEWLGEIPVGWEVKRWRYCCRIAEGQVDPRDPKYSERVMIAPNHIESATGRIIFTETAEEQGAISGKYLVREGNMIYSKIRPALNKACIARGEWLCSADMYPIEVTCDDLGTKYLLYFTLSDPFVRLMVDASMRVAMPKVNRETLLPSPLLVPPLPEQRVIAAFLDRETGKIDALVEKKERLIELLQEKRTALITRAVTKGLDPDAPMKDSGVEWLGEIPAHWELAQLRRIIRAGTTITYGIVQAGPDIPDGVPYIRTSDMSGDVLPKDGYKRTSTEIDRSYRRSKVQTDDIVIAIRASVGKVLPVPHYLDGANLTQGTAKIAPGPLVTSSFLLRALQSQRAQYRFVSLAKGATFREITLDMLRRFSIVVPPVDEQNQIVVFLDQETARIDTLVGKVREATDRLKEYRTALISAAVTGKIDVRDATDITHGRTS